MFSFISNQQWLKLDLTEYLSNFVLTCLKNIAASYSKATMFTILLLARRLAIWWNFRFWSLPCWRTQYTEREISPTARRHSNNWFLLLLSMSLYRTLIQCSESRNLLRENDCPDQMVNCLGEGLTLETLTLKLVEKHKVLQNTKSSRTQSPQRYHSHLYIWTCRTETSLKIQSHKLWWYAFTE